MHAILERGAVGRWFWVKAMSAEVSFPLLVHILDLFGTMAFAVTGAFKAIEHKSDIVGIIILATITGVTGGVVRDIVFGRMPPIAVTDPLYLVITTATAVATFFLYKKLKKHWNMFLKFDAIGLGVFTIIGASFAYELAGLNFLAMAFAGLVTAIGGGILRDVFVNEVPIVFVKELYASASFAGVVILFGLLAAGVDLSVAAVPAFGAVTALRLLAMKYNWNLPRPKV
jgi:uncharacterized membrane protein YeiH